jgi:hypothetical protein
VEPKADALEPPNAGALAPKGVEPAPLNAGVLCANENAGAEVAPKPGVAPPPKGDAGRVLPNRVLALDAPNAGAEKPKLPAAGALDAPKELPKPLVPPKAGVLAAVEPKAGVLDGAPKAGCDAPNPPPNPAGQRRLCLQAVLTVRQLLCTYRSDVGRAPVDVLPKGDEVVLPNRPPPVPAAEAPKAGCVAPKAGAVVPNAEPPKAGADCCA